MTHMINHRSFLSCLALLAAMAVMLAACGGTPAEPAGEKSEPTAPTQAMQTEAASQPQPEQLPEQATEQTEPSEDPHETVASDPTSAPDPDDDHPYLYNDGGTPELPGADVAEDEISVSGFEPLQRASLGELGHDLKLVSAGRYTGPFMEDGSDEPVENVLALVIRNCSDTMVEYCTLTLGLDGTPCSFAITALPANSCCLVLESNRRTVREDTALALPRVESCAQLIGGVMDYSSDFALYPADGVINIKNVSGHDINGDIYVCYKHFADNVYLGGIAYRASFGTVRADEIGQSLQSHFVRSSCVILYMDYDHA